MLNDLDDTIREILITAGGFDPSEVDIRFDIPTREWSGGISKPTLNCYMFDIHERRVLREEGWRLEGRGTRASARHSPPLFFEISYLITAWTANHQVDDEHRLLWRALETLMDMPVLGEEVLKGALRDHEWPIHTTLAQLEGVLKSPGEFWTALENQLKPSISYTVTLGRDRRPRPTDAPPVLSTGIRLRLPESTAESGFRIGDVFPLPQGVARAGVKVAAFRLPEKDTDEPAGGAGAAAGDSPPEKTATTDAEGHFRLDLPPGRYRLEATVGGELRRRTIVISGEARGAGAALSDVVLDQHGQPLPGVAVEVEGLGLRTVTDAEGRFGFDLPPGQYALRIQLDGWTQRRKVTVRPHTYTLHMAYGGVPAEDDAGDDS